MLSPKLAGIEAQEVVRLDIEVVAQPGEVLVVDASAQDGYVAVAVEDGIILYEDIIWDSVGTERIEGIIGVELLEVHLAVTVSRPRDDVFQIATTLRCPSPQASTWFMNCRRNSRGISCWCPGHRYPGRYSCA